LVVVSKNALISVKVDKGALRLIDLAAKSTYLAGLALCVKQPERFIRKQVGILLHENWIRLIPLSHLKN
jgi:hypothetical protein